MNYDIINLIESYLNINQKDIILEFLKKENYFYNVINSGEPFNREEMVNLGKQLNFLSKKIKYSKEEFTSYKEYLSYVGIQAILSLKYIPENFRLFYIENEFSGISGPTLSEIYKIMYVKYLLINTIYTQNGEYGLIKYIIINKKLSNLYNISFYDLIHFNDISIEEVINYTSIESDINKNCTTDITHKIFNKEKIFKNKDTIYL